MKMYVGENSAMTFEEVYNSILFKTRDGEKMAICMCDSGFEFNYQGQWYSAQNGKVKKMIHKTSKKADKEMLQTNTQS